MKLVSLVVTAHSLFLAAAAPALAQVAPTTVHLIVADSAGSRIAQVEVTALKDLNRVVGHATTTAAGAATLSLDTVSGDVQIVARRIGFVPTRRFVEVPQSGTLSVTIQLTRQAAELPTVRVNAEADIRHRRLFIDADAIENSPRRLDDGLDIIRKLRPDMVFGLGGRKFCQPASELWVNGKRMFWQTILADDRAGTEARKMGLPAWIGAALARIRPEHIQQITYHDCMDMSVGKLGSDRAIFVVLKPGVAYDVADGAYVLPTRPPLVRILGIFDDESGRPIAGAKVTDLGSGTSAVTTVSGTISLSFVISPSTRLRVEAPGYEPLEFSTAGDTASITATLRKRQPQ